MNMNDLYLVQDLKGFVEYVKYQLKDNLNPFRLRSALYFAFGYYTGFYRYKLESNNSLLLYELNDLFRELVETNTFDLYDRLFEEPHIKNTHINSDQKDLYNKDIASYYLGECN